MRFCGEIIYETEDGTVHSDICHKCSADPKFSNTELSDESRAFLHKALDEWLNKSDGSGAFWVGDPNYFTAWENKEYFNG